MATRIELEAMAVAQALTLIQDLEDEEVEECEALSIELNLYGEDLQALDPHPFAIASWETPTLIGDLSLIAFEVTRLHPRGRTLWDMLTESHFSTPPRGRSEIGFGLDDNATFSTPPIIGVTLHDPTPGTVPVMVATLRGDYVSTYDPAIHGPLAREGYDSNYIYPRGSTYSLGSTSVSQVLGTAPEEEAPSFWKLLTQD